MKTIDRNELKTKIDHDSSLKLIMAMDDLAYNRLHIPGSLHFSNMAEATTQLSVDDEIVVYCTNPLCRASIIAYWALDNYGFHKVYRYSGGLADWQAAGYPLEGTMATEVSHDSSNI